MLNSRHFTSTHYQSSPDTDTKKSKPPTREAKLAILAKVKKNKQKTGQFNGCSFTLNQSS